MKTHEELFHDRVQARNKVKVIRTFRTPMERQTGEAIAIKITPRLKEVILNPNEQ